MTDVSEAPGTEYFRWFYDTGVWKHMHYRGIRVLKVPSDMWNYQEIFTEHRIDWVLETGSMHGGSALFFADLLKLNGAQGKVISIDIEGRRNMLREEVRAINGLDDEERAAHFSADEFRNRYSDSERQWLDGITRALRDK